MVLFDKIFKGRKQVYEVEGVLCSPVNGTVKSLESLNDGMFSEKILGDGIVILPSDGVFKAPVSGILETVFPTGHAYGIRTDSGIAVLVHIGIDTVEMAGKGFHPLVEQGQRIQVGDKMVEVDLNAIKKSGYRIETMIVLTDGNEIVKEVNEEDNIQCGDRLLKVI